MTSLRTGPRTEKRLPEEEPAPSRRLRVGDPTAVQQGAAILVLLALAGAVIFFLDPIQRRLSEEADLVVTAPRARDLAPGADVWVAGIRSGRVRSIRFRPPDGAGDPRVVIHLTLTEDAARHVRDGAEAWIQPASLLSPPVLAIGPGPPGAPPFDFDDTLRVAEQTTVRELMARAGTARRLLDTLHAAGQRLSHQLREGDGTLGRLRRDTALRRTLHRDLREIRRFATALRGNRGLAALRRAGGEDVLGGLVASGRWLSDALDARGEATVGLDEALASLAGRARRLDSLTALGRGTAGRLRADGELRAQLRTLAEDAARTRAVLFADPFRWLRFRLF